MALLQLFLSLLLSINGKLLRQVLLRWHGRKKIIIKRGFLAPVGASDKTRFSHFLLANCILLSYLLVELFGDLAL